MSRRPALITQADITRAINAAKKAGMTVEILPAVGVIRLSEGGRGLPESIDVDQDRVIPL